MVIFLGVLVSLIAQIAKKILGTSGVKNLALVAGLSLAAAGLYQFFTFIGYWDLVVTVLTTAGAFYTFIIARFPGASSEVQPAA